MNKVNKILKKERWSLVSTKNNPADITSRGITPFELLNDPTWLHGPSFLYLSESNWPVLPSIDISHNEFESIALHISDEISSSLLNIFPVEKYSSFASLLETQPLC